MGFLTDISSIGSIRSIFMGLMLILINFNSEYLWPADYLTWFTFSCEGSQGAIQLGSFVHSYSRSCDLNACDGFVADNLPVFDYIIVGSGVAGSVLAYRLTKANESRKVLLIEDGSDPLINSLIPRLFLFNLNNTGTYKFYAEKSSDFSLAFKNSTNLNVGNCIGGSSQINAMLYMCGTNNDYNSWAESSGDSSWTYKNMLPFIIKHQNMKDEKVTIGPCAKFHGTDGPLRVNNVGLNSDKLVPYLRATVKELNYSELKDINCGPKVGYNGFVNIPMTINNGQRESSARAFLIPLANNKNFYFMRNSFVNKLLIEKNEHNEVVVKGVNVMTSNKRCSNIQLKASREVILSAGALNTPKILLNSGIGRNEDLGECKIEQFLDLNVGRNFQDHIFSIHFYVVPSGLFTTKPNFYDWLSSKALQYTSTFKGYFSTLSSINYGAFLNTKNLSSKYPDVQWVFSRYDRSESEFTKILNDKLGFDLSFSQQIFDLNQNYSIIQILNVGLAPKSRGSIQLRSCTDFKANPIINGGYFSDKSDLETLVRGSKALEEFFNSYVMKKIGVKQAPLKIKECDILTSKSDDYRRCYIKYFSTSIWHPCCTASFGMKSDRNAVVDSKLKVIGVKGKPSLRVVDASIMPTITHGNTQCPVYTIAEKAAEIILDSN